MKNKFTNADEAFNYLYPLVCEHGVDYAGTKTLFNVGFTLENPGDRNIITPYRGFSLNYADAEWEWYLSGDPNPDRLGEIYGKVPPIWDHMRDENGIVRSNYGWQWQRNGQLAEVIMMLRNNPETRQAVISIYDGKEIRTYGADTPCTYAVNFTIVDGKLNMSVLMRSNDVWFGFCNDQYCFSMLQEKVAGSLNIPMGTYYHHATNFHVYNKQLNRHK